LLTVRITLEEDVPIIKFEVDLFGLPDTTSEGHEVTVNFHATDIDNDGIFYTDSNGLEMQERKLNYRPTWNLTLTENENISANYFPVNTAIAVRDKESGLAMTVMNDRS